MYPDYQTELCFCIALCAILPSACHKCHLLSVETAGHCVLGLKLPLHVRSEVVQSSDRWKTALSFLHTRMAFLKHKAQMRCFSKWCEQTWKAFLRSWCGFWPPGWTKTLLFISHSCLCMLLLVSSLLLWQMSQSDSTEVCRGFGTDFTRVCINILAQNQYNCLS